MVKEPKRAGQIELTFFSKRNNFAMFYFVLFVHTHTQQRRERQLFQVCRILKGEQFPCVRLSFVFIACNRFES